MSLKSSVKASDLTVTARKGSGGEYALAFQISALKLAPAVREYKFHPERKWRFDFAYPDKKCAIEIEGGHWTGGRHTRAKGFESDCEKYCEAARLGWRVFRVTTDMVVSGYAIGLVRSILEET